MKNNKSATDYIRDLSTIDKDVLLGTFKSLISDCIEDHKQVVLTVLNTNDEYVVNQLIDMLISSSYSALTCNSVFFGMRADTDSYRIKELSLDECKNDIEL